MRFRNHRGTAEQWIKEGKNAVKWTKLSCRRFKDNAARLPLFALAYNTERVLAALLEARPLPSLQRGVESAVGVAADVPEGVHLKKVGSSNLSLGNAMADTGSSPGAIFAQMTVSSEIGPPPPPALRSVSGFPALSNTVASLPLLEQIDLRMMADWAIDTHEFAGFPVTKITCIGHADRDFQRGKTFERQVSERRAEAVKTFFVNEVTRLGFSIFDLVQPGFVPIVKRIAFESQGVGSSEHVPAQNEAGRRRNRRVTIVLERDRSPQRPPLFIVDITKLPLPPHDPNPPLPHPWTRPIPPPIKLPKSALEEKLDQFRKSPLRFLDMGSIGKGSFNMIREFIDPTSPGPEREKAEEELAKDLRDYWEEEKRNRDVRTKDPPGDLDPN